MKSISSYFFISLLLIALSCKDKETEEDLVMVEPPFSEAIISTKVLTQSLTHPWELVWGPDNFIWMTERAGKVSRVNPETGAVTLVSAIADVRSVGEGGLLGMVLHPNFTSTPNVFLAYNYEKPGSGYIEKIVKYTYANGALTNPVILLDNIPASSIHNGARLVITPDLKLFISTGDAANQPSAQNINSLSGKILRINLDGTIPADNPISGNPLWSLGHRNPQGLVYAKDKLYSSEHGPDKDDEINIILKNRNFGWPNVNGFCNESGEQAFCTANNVVVPLKNWTPTIAVSGMEFYDNKQIPQWQNSLLVATLKDQTLYQHKLSENGDQIIESKEFLRGQFGRLRDVCIAPTGKVYVATGNGNNDKIIEISRSN